MNILKMLVKTYYYNHIFIGTREMKFASMGVKGAMSNDTSPDPNGGGRRLCKLNMLYMFYREKSWNLLIYGSFKRDWNR
jgi:hypothetical protein